MSLRPKKIETPYRVRVIGGRFKGAVGTVVDIYDDGLLGIDTDEGGRAFALEEQTFLFPPPFKADNFTPLENIYKDDAEEEK
jgi:hypothetical protein